MREADAQSLSAFILPMLNMYNYIFHHKAYPKSDQLQNNYFKLLGLTNLMYSIISLLILIHHPENLIVLRRVLEKDRKSEPLI